MNRRSAIAAIAMALATLFASTNARAQGLRDRDPNLSAAREIASQLQSAWFRSGPFYLISRLQLADIGYDLHFYIPTESDIGLRWAVSAPQRLYFVPVRKVVASVEVTPSLALASKRPRTQWGYSSRADLQLLFNYVTLDAYMTGLNDLRAKTGEINSIVTTQERETGISGQWKYSSRTDGTFSAVRRATSFPVNRLQPQSVIDVLPLLDRTEIDYRATVSHKTFPLTSLYVAVEDARYDFRHTSSLDSDRWYTALGARYDNGPTAITGEVGRETLKFRHASHPGFDGIIGNATASHRFGTRTTGTLNAVRDIDFSIFVNNGYYVADRYGATVTYDWTRRLRLRAITQRGFDRYKVPLGPLSRKDSLSWDAVGWEYSRRFIQGGFDVGYYRRSTTFGEESHGIRYLLHLSLNL